MMKPNWQKLATLVIQTGHFSRLSSLCMFVAPMGHSV